MSNRLHGDGSCRLAQGVELFGPGISSIGAEFDFHQFMMFQCPIQFRGDRRREPVLPESDDRFQSVSEGPQLFDLVLLQGLFIFHGFAGDRCRLAGRN